MWSGPDAEDAVGFGLDVAGSVLVLSDTSLFLVDSFVDLGRTANFFSGAAGGTGFGGIGAGGFLLTLDCGAGTCLDVDDVGWCVSDVSVVVLLS